MSQGTNAEVLTQMLEEQAAIKERMEKDKEKLDGLNKTLGSHYAKKIGPVMEQLQKLIGTSEITKVIRKEVQEKLVQIFLLLVEPRDTQRVIGVILRARRPGPDGLPPRSLKSGTVAVPKDLYVWMVNNADGPEAAKSIREIEAAQGVPAGHSFKPNQWENFMASKDIKITRDGKSMRSTKYYA